MCTPPQPPSRNRDSLARCRPLAIGFGSKSLSGDKSFWPFRRLPGPNWFSVAQSTLATIGSRLRCSRDVFRDRSAKVERPCPNVACGCKRPPRMNYEVRRSGAYKVWSEWLPIRSGLSPPRNGCPWATGTDEDWTRTWGKDGDIPTKDAAQVRNCISRPDFSPREEWLEHIDHLGWKNKPNTERWIDGFDCGKSKTVLPLFHYWVLPQIRPNVGLLFLIERLLFLTALFSKLLTLSVWIPQITLMFGCQTIITEITSSLNNPKSSLSEGIWFVWITTGIFGKGVWHWNWIPLLGN